MGLVITTDLLTIIGADTQLRRRASTYGGEYKGPCPWCGGRDRFLVWPKQGRYWCRQCNRSGDALQYLRDRDGLGYHEAYAQLGIEPHGIYGQRPPRTELPPPVLLEPPNSAWQAAAGQFVQESHDHLHTTAGSKALAWLQHRGLALETIQYAGLGYNPIDWYADRTTWGLTPAIGSNGALKRVWLPRGIVIPWFIDGQLWRVNIRRPLGDPKYVGPAGWKNALYAVDQFRAGAVGHGSHQRPTVLVEGEFDALSMHQAAGNLVAAVATGSTGGARHLKWIVRLAMAPLVLVAYDADEPGEKAASYWVDMLPHAKRWRPFWQDANAMAQDGVDLRAWVEAGLFACGPRYQ